MVGAARWGVAVALLALLSGCGQLAHPPRPTHGSDYLRPIPRNQCISRASVAPPYAARKVCIHKGARLIVHLPPLRTPWEGLAVTPPYSSVLRMLTRRKTTGGGEVVVYAATSPGRVAIFAANPHREVAAEFDLEVQVV